MDKDKIHRRAILPVSHVWLSGVIIAVSLMVLGYSLTFPIAYSSLEFPILTVVSPIFWAGLISGLICLVGWVLSTENSYSHYIATELFVFISSAAQFLYISWGPDAGSLASFVNYNMTTSNFDLGRDVSTNSYFQWPGSIFFHRFLTDLFSVDTFTAVKLGFFLVILCFSSGLFLFWYKLDRQRSLSTRWVFIGVTIYFTSIFLFQNWEAVPYTFFLALFLPALALMENSDPRYRVIFMLFTVIAMESHPLGGLWLSLILGVLLILDWIRTKRVQFTHSVFLFVLVVQTSLIIYKNISFFMGLTNMFRGYLRALLDSDASDRAIANQVRSALTFLPTDWMGRILKTISYVDIGFIFIIIVIATLFVLWKRKIRLREISLAAAGVIHFLIGTQYAAIGSRSLQLIVFLPASFVIDTLMWGSNRLRRLLVVLNVIVILLFPSMLMRSIQISDNFVKVSDLYIEDFLGQHLNSSGAGTVILTEGIRPIDLRLSYYLIRPREQEIIAGCYGDFIIINTENWRLQSENIVDRVLAKDNLYAPGTDLFEYRLRDLNASLTYSIGNASIMTGADCTSLQWLFYLEK